MKNRYPIRAAFSVSATASSLLACVFLTGCESAPATAVPKMMISGNLPELMAMPETKEAQEKGGVEIAVVPATYSTATKHKYSVQPKNPGFGSMLGASIVTGGKSANLIYVAQTVTPFLDVRPSRLQFTVRVNNKLSRVFRGQGAVVQFNVGGKLVPFGDTDYVEVINGIVPPRNENTFTIRGPLLDTLPEKGTIGIFLYDVVTKTDVAGNVTEKQNYEWYFDYAVKRVEALAEIRRSESFMDQETFQQALLTARKRSMEDDTPQAFANR